MDFFVLHDTGKYTKYTGYGTDNTVLQTMLGTRRMQMMESKYTAMQTNDRDQRPLHFLRLISDAGARVRGRSVNPWTEVLLPLGFETPPGQSAFYGPIILDAKSAAFNYNAKVTEHIEHYLDIASLLKTDPLVRTVSSDQSWQRISDRVRLNGTLYDTAPENDIALNTFLNTPFFL